jgi:hypothetical protein
MAKKAHHPKRPTKRAAAKPARTPAKQVYASLCAACGSTRIDKVNSIDTCADCRSTQILTIPHTQLEVEQNKILEHKVEERFHQYMEDKHHRMARMRFVKLALAIVAVIVLAFVIIAFAGI